MPHAQNPRNPAYLAAKSYYLDLEIQGIVSIQVLQAQILIALFEYGRVMGIDWSSSSSEKKPFAWVDREEQRRVWWAIAILNCLARIGYPSRLSLTENLTPDVHLPADGAAWDQGEMPPKILGILQPRSNQDLGRFALAAEGTRLLGQVLQHIAAKNLDNDLHKEEALLLDRTLQALESVVKFEGQQSSVSVMNQTAICSTGRIVLHEAHISKKTGISEYFGYINLAKSIANIIRKSRADSVTNGPEQAFNSCVVEASPFLTTLIYHGAVANLRLDRKLGTEDSSEGLAAVKAALRDFDSRWKSSGAYLQILEARELSSIQ